LLPHSLPLYFCLNSPGPCMFLLYPFATPHFYEYLLSADILYVCLFVY
jgi:hypothetical protein